MRVPRPAAKIATATMTFRVPYIQTEYIVLSDSLHGFSEEIDDFGCEPRRITDRLLQEQKIMAAMLFSTAARL
jgi:hypothetical protein